MTRWRQLLFTALLASVVIPTLPRMLTMMRLARQLWPLAMDQRREVVGGEFYRAVERLRREVPPQEPIALVATRPSDVGESLFVNYYLFPHPTRSYRDRMIYGMLNPKDRPRTIVTLSGAPRVVSYAELRDMDLRRSHVVQNVILPPEGRTQFILPIVTSMDAPPPDTYTTEGTLATDGEAHVTLTLQPANLSKTLTIRGTHRFYDLVYECFHRTDTGWLSVRSDAPVRAAFFLVNRGTQAVTPIEIISGPLAHTVAFPASKTAKLWLLNFGDAPVLARIGSDGLSVPPRALWAVGAHGAVTGPVFAFLSERLPNGGTRFTWPDDVP
jgi:hypothetical protein